jgi:hypothetical protein
MVTILMDLVLASTISSTNQMPMILFCASSRKFKQDWQIYKGCSPWLESVIFKAILPLELNLEGHS